ncbi:hypothetical protein FB446DRAFT_836913 [Lentinula raphanica]|nr:hypothetical protein FB446DRAFT_836913 [Lentinula raphanica]
MSDKAIKISAEHVLRGLLQVPDAPWNVTHLEYSRNLLTMFLAVPNLFSYESGKYNLLISPILPDLEILKALLEVRPFGFALDVVSVPKRISELGQMDKMIADLQPGTRTMTLKSNTNPIILRMVRNSQTKWQTRTSSSGWMSKTIQVHPRLMSMMHNSDIEPGYTMIAYSAELEAEVNGIYEQMYDENTTIDEGWPPDTSWALNCPLRRFSSSSGSKHVLGLNTDYANGDHCETNWQRLQMGQRDMSSMFPQLKQLLFSAFQLDVVNEAVTVPVDEISDKILFIIDDLAPNNFSAQLEGMQVLFKDMYSLRLPS